jgi:TRAP transporter TAXI family solute receptor
MPFDGGRRLIFGGAGQPGSGTPWRTLGEIAAQALAGAGYEVEIDGRAWGVANPRLIADGQMDFGGGFASRVRWAFEGVHDYAGDPPRSNLRILAAIEHPSWLAVAVRWESGITELSRIRERQLPVRVRGGGDAAGRMILEHYGLSRSQIESWGGRFPPRPAPAGYPRIDEDRSMRDGDFDVIIDTLYAANTPEARHWIEASVLFNLRFLPLPSVVIERICKEVGGVPGAIPNRLVRGITEPVPTVQRPPQVIYAREDMPEDLAYTIARALDESRHLFRLTHIPFSYDPRTASADVGVPLHPGAARYYRASGSLR